MSEECGGFHQLSAKGPEGDAEVSHTYPGVQ